MPPVISLPTIGHEPDITDFTHLRIPRMGRKPLLTKEKVLAALRQWTARNGGLPSVDELRQELGVASTRTVFRYLRMLESDRVAADLFAFFVHIDAVAEQDHAQDDRHAAIATVPVL